MACYYLDFISEILGGQSSQSSYVELGSPPWITEVNWKALVSPQQIIKSQYSLLMGSRKAKMHCLSWGKISVISTASQVIYLPVWNHNFMYLIILTCANISVFWLFSMLMYHFSCHIYISGKNDIKDFFSQDCPQLLLVFRQFLNFQLLKQWKLFNPTDKISTVVVSGPKFYF